MKKSLVALAVLAAAGAASAQSSVTLFGIVDATVTWGSTSGGTHLWRLANSGYNSSRLGFRGTEDLGGGTAASFWLEAGVNNDSGLGAATNATNQASVAGLANGQQGLTFNRRSTVSLSGRWGEVRLGRDYTPSFWNLTVFDPFGTNGVGTNVMLTVPAGTIAGAPANYSLVNGGSTLSGTTGTIVRSSNSVGYFLPGNLGGFYGQAMYAFGENQSNAGAPPGTTSLDGRVLSGRFGYANGPVNVAAGYGKTRFAKVAGNLGGDFRTWNIGGQWDFGVAKLMGQYGDDARNAAVTVDGKGWLIGGLVPVGAGEIRVAYSQYKITENTAAFDPKVRQLAVGYVHNLSRRTALYTTAAYVRNSSGAAGVAYTLNGSTVSAATGANPSSRGVDFGIRHSF